jgi:hypothetical protein
MRSSTGRRFSATILVLLGGLVPATGRADVPLSVPRADLQRALACQPAVRDARREPVLLVTGTGGDAATTWSIHQRQLTRAGFASCRVALPDHSTGDMQTAAEYVVAAVRAMHARSGHRVGIFGISQGAVLPRLALTFWPSLRPLVADVVAAAGTQHGTGSQTGPLPGGLPPSAWQQQRGSKLLTALNAGDESPGPTAWTTVHSTTDVVVTPASGPHATSVLRGARNVVVQGVCPGRQEDHVGVLFDSVTFATLLDALRHRGAARAKRFPASVCAHVAMPGLTDAQKTDITSGAYPALVKAILGAPRVPREPALRAPFSSALRGELRKSQ